MARDLDMATAGLLLGQTAFLCGVAAVLAMQGAFAEAVADGLKTEPFVGTETYASGTVMEWDKDGSVVITFPKRARP